MAVEIHPTAIVDAKAELGVDVKVGPYSIIGSQVKLGDGCLVGPHVVIEGITTIGKQTRIFQFASVGSQPQDLKYHGEPSTLVIGEKNIIREYVTLQPGTEGGGMITKIGDGNLFMANCHVGHDCIVGNSNVLANSAPLAGHVTIGNFVIVGGLAAVHQFVRIGDYAMLSGGAMVGQDVPPYAIVQGDRAEIRGINLVALKRRGFSEDDVRVIKRAFRHLFMHRGKIEQKIAELDPEIINNPRIHLILDFVKSSERGICNASMSFE